MSLIKCHKLLEANRMEQQTSVAAVAEVEAVAVAATRRPLPILAIIFFIITSFVGTFHVHWTDREQEEDRKPSEWQNAATGQ